MTASEHTIACQRTQCGVSSPREADSVVLSGALGLTVGDRWQPWGSGAHGSQSGVAQVRLRSMCGRYSSSRRDADLVRAFTIADVVGEELRPSWNVAPMQQARVVLERAPRDDPQGEPSRQLRTVRWGLVPSWAKDPKVGSRMINARSETVTEKPSFKAAAARRRALVVADGYYEWQKSDDGKTKTPYFLHDGEHLLAFAGLYELRPDPALPDDHPDKWGWTFTIVTRSAPDALGHIHDRCPVVVPRDAWGPWLDPHTTDLAVVDALLGGFADPLLTPREVGPAVGNVRNNGPELVAPV